MQTVEQALEGRYEITDCGFDTPCWLWTRGKTTAGYAEAFAEGRVVYAHRAMYESRVGPIGAGLTTHHRCEQRSCINPDHMEFLTREDHAGAAGHGKLTADQAADVCARARAGQPHREIAAQFDISTAMVSLIRNGKRWRAAVAT